MLYEDLPDNPEQQCQVTFEDHETPCIRAVYREHIDTLAQKGNVGSISDHDRYLSEYGVNGYYPAVPFISAESLIEKLNEFYENTDSAITLIANSSYAPPHENHYIVDRYDLGQQALALTVEVQQEAEPSFTKSVMRSLNSLPETDSNDLRG